MAATPPSRRRNPPVGMQPLSPQRKWRAIMVATLVLVPGFWALLAGLVAGAADDSAGRRPHPMSPSHWRWGLRLFPSCSWRWRSCPSIRAPPGAVLRAMGWALLVGIPVSALAGGAVTGIVAGVGAGGIQALRMDDPQNWRARAWAVVVASVYTLVLVRTAGALVLLPAPIFPLTAIGIADHLSERRAEQAASPRAGG